MFSVIAADGTANGVLIGHNSFIMPHALIVVQMPHAAELYYFAQAGADLLGPDSLILFTEW
jgi:hypothetical protein